MTQTTCHMSISLDGFAAGPDQSREHPLGRGGWDEDWRGWWGDEPPYHAPVFVLTHHARDPIEMEGGTTFHFVTAGFDAAYAQARETAGDDGVDIAGGASTVR